MKCALFFLFIWFMYVKPVEANDGLFRKTNIHRGADALPKRYHHPGWSQGRGAWLQHFGGFGRFHAKNHVRAGTKLDLSGRSVLTKASCFYWLTCVVGAGE